LDGLGSVVALSDVNRVLVERYTYDVFGRPTIRDANGTEVEASACGNPYRFTGRAWDAETALYYYRARYYDYATARFLQPDPTGYTDGLNLYSYCGNNPVNWIDPLGLCRDYLSPSQRAELNRAAARAMTLYAYRPDFLEYGNFVLRNERTGELYVVKAFATGTERAVDPAKAFREAQEEVGLLPDDYVIVAFCHRHPLPDGLTLGPAGEGQVQRAQPNSFSVGDMNYAQVNQSGGPIDVYLVNREGDMRFYNPVVHGPHTGQPLSGTGVGNIGDYGVED
jgi:RHS repeat-associated protein